MLVAQHHGGHGVGRDVVARAGKRDDLLMAAARVVHAHGRVVLEQEVGDALVDLSGAEPDRLARGCGRGAASTSCRLIAASAAAGVGRRTSRRVKVVLASRGLVGTSLRVLDFDKVRDARLACEHDGPFHARRHLREVGVQFLFGGPEHRRRAAAAVAGRVRRNRCRRTRRRGEENRRCRHGAVRGGRPGEDLEHEVVLDRRDDVTGGLLVQPPFAAPLPGVQIALHPPGLHLLDRPLRGLVVVGRAGEPRPVHVGEHVHDSHDLRPVEAFGPDLRVHRRVDFFGRQLDAGLLGGGQCDHERQREERHDHPAQHGRLLEQLGRLGRNHT